MPTRASAHSMQRRVMRQCRNWGSRATGSSCPTSTPWTSEPTPHRTTSSVTSLAHFLWMTGIVAENLLSLGLSAWRDKIPVCNLIWLISLLANQEVLTIRVFSWALRRLLFDFLSEPSEVGGCSQIHTRSPDSVFRVQVNWRTQSFSSMARRPCTPGWRAASATTSWSSSAK